MPAKDAVVEWLKPLAAVLAIGVTVFIAVNRALVDVASELSTLKADVETLKAHAADKDIHESDDKKRDRISDVFDDRSALLLYRLDKIEGKIDDLIQVNHRRYPDDPFGTAEGEGPGQ